MRGGWMVWQVVQRIRDTSGDGRPLRAPFEIGPYRPWIAASANSHGALLVWSQFRCGVHMRTLRQGGCAVSAVSSGGYSATPTRRRQKLRDGFFVIARYAAVSSARVLVRLLRIAKCTALERKPRRDADRGKPLGADKRLVKGDEFTHDARAVAAVPQEQLEKALAELDGATGFVGPTKLQEIVGSVIADSAVARDVASFIGNLEQLQRRMGSSFLDEFQRDFEKHSVLDKAQKQRIIAVLPRVLQKRTALDHNAKAQTLASRLGGHLYHFSITCDLRPVFNDARDTIDGMFPVTTLKVQVHETYESTCVTASLSAKELTKISEQVANAQKKAAALMDHIRKNNIPVPEAGFRAGTTADTDDEEDDS
jgi:hypothetical protein